MKKLLFIKSEITWTIKYILFFIKNFKYIFSNKKKFVFIGTPLYDNIGDLGIYVAEKQYLEKEFSNIPVLEVSLDLIGKHQKAFRVFIKKDIIFMIGGGFLGTLWIDNEIIIRNIIKTYSNPIIIFPQTMYYEDDEQGRKELIKSIDIYSSHSDLSVCLRETRSYNFAQEHFKKNNIMFVPDSVLCLKEELSNKDRNGIGLCFRNDKEKTSNLKVIEIIKDSFPDVPIIKTDMIGHCRVTKANRSSLVKDKLEELSSYKLVITDRLHGMIFSAITNTPVIAFDNKSHKISEVNKLMSEFDFVKFTDGSEIDFKNKLDLIKTLIDEKEEFKFDSNKYELQYEKLTNKISELLKK